MIKKNLLKLADFCLNIKSTFECYCLEESICKRIAFIIAWQIKNLRVDSGLNCLSPMFIKISEKRD